MNTYAPVLFGPLDTASIGRRKPLSPQAWTCVGLLAIPLWATWPALALRALTIPAFECLTIAFAFGWAVLRQLEKQKRAAQIGESSIRSWIPALACALGLTGSNAFHILATHYIPAAEANLLFYLWPIEIIAFGAALRLFRLRPLHVLGLFLAFVGAMTLMGRGAVTLSFAGIGLAVISGLSWALYCVFRLMWKAEPTRVLERGCAISAALCGALHFALEKTSVPDLGAIAASAAVGIVPLAIGNLVWDEGFRRGDSQLMAVMAYATPLLSAVLLIALGLEQFTVAMGVGGTLIVLAGLISRNSG